ncbi:sphinganine C4-monooxygenase 2-like [Henckelia pumila]|uniref:sphinganine C4-monooxygenase 2-like n=1 Tax=Henckelia pumila TaxID=405737 RepID=UPI003C6E3863
MIYDVPEELLGTFVPIMVYWVYSVILYVMAGSVLEKYRLHPQKEEDDKNIVPKKEVVKGVLLQQALQAAVASLLYAIIRSKFESAAGGQSSVVVVAVQFVVAMVVLDTWQYFMHRYMHHNKFLYRHIHSYHHRLVVPYGFGALYNHPLECLVMDTIGGVLAFLVSGMSPRAAIFFFSFTALKIVDDHCGLRLPWNLFQLLFSNNSAYHDIHHSLHGSKYNFAQPFFVMWV